MKNSSKLEEIKKYLSKSLSDYNGGMIVRTQFIENQWYVEYISRFGDIRNVWFNKDNISVTMNNEEL